MKLSSFRFGAAGTPPTFNDPVSWGVIAPTYDPQSSAWFVLDNEGNEWEYENGVWTVVSSNGAITSTSGAAGSTLPVGATSTGAAGATVVLPESTASTATTAAPTTTSSNPTATTVAAVTTGTPTPATMSTSKKLLWLGGAALVLWAFWPNKGSTPVTTPTP
jgi:hypothetical protein